MSQDDTYDQEQVIEKFISELLENMVDSDPAFSKTVDDHFWELS